MSLRLPACPACGAFHFPPRDICPACHYAPVQAMPLRDAPGSGEILAVAVVHLSLDPAFKDRLPAAIATVRLDVGPVVIAFNDGGALPGARVEVTPDPRAGGDVLRAAPIG